MRTDRRVSAEERAWSVGTQCPAHTQCAARVRAALGRATRLRSVCLNLLACSAALPHLQRLSQRSTFLKGHNKAKQLKAARGRGRRGARGRVSVCSRVGGARPAGKVKRARALACRRPGRAAIALRHAKEAHHELVGQVVARAHETLRATRGDL